jgi:uncharacterized membrane protein (DUF4010 family)
MMAQGDLFLRFGVAIGLGFVIGLQREFAKGAEGREVAAGERTFALIGLAGCMGAMAAELLESSLAFIGVLIVLGIFTAIAYSAQAWRGQVGLTTEITILVTAMIGALCYWGHLTLAVAIGITTTVLLSLKLETDRLVRALTREDITAALQFAVISAVILPVLPNESLWGPPFDVINPFKIWLMVVFISGISFLGYVLIKVVGSHRGIGLTGFLGGLVSSTAVTLSFSERSQREVGLAKPFALAILVAWTMMFPRVLVEVSVLHLPLLELVWVPIAVSGLLGLAYSTYLFFSQRAAEKGEMEFSNPFDLGAAIKFGMLYGVILLLARTAQFYFGETGVLFSSVLSGLADVDAITLSVAELSRNGGLALDTASRAVVLASMANTAVKGGIVLVSGTTALRKAIWPGLALMLAAGIGVAFLL